MSSPPGDGPRRRSPFARAFSDRDGNLRTGLLLALTAATIVVLAIGMFASLLFAGAGSPGALAAWVTAAFIFVKLPFLAVVWWILSRWRDPPGGGGWTGGETDEILAYLETQARESVGRPDAASRLAYFAREAWFVADTADDAHTPAAVDTAVMIEAMAAEAGAPVDRSPARRPVEPGTA
jgi:hypothetical protein